MELQRVLHEIFLRSPSNLFDEFMLECQKWYDEPAHTFTEMRTRDNKKIRGDIFEEFCVLYLKFIKGHNSVWRLEDVPDTILEKLSMKRKDMGIDIVIYDGNDVIAVQCKYKKRGLAKSAVSWQALSTFYALCMRTGPWTKYVVMTNCDYVRHQGKKTSKDISYVLNTFRTISGSDWIKMCELTGQKIVTDVVQNTITDVSTVQMTAEELAKPSKEQLRQLRMAYYTKKTETNIIDTN
jgi:predicted helicase